MTLPSNGFVYFGKERIISQREEEEEGKDEDGMREEGGRRVEGGGREDGGGMEEEGRRGGWREKDWILRM